jgi:hypothetical protein
VVGVQETPTTTAAQHDISVRIQSLRTESLTTRRQSNASQLTQPSRLWVGKDSLFDMLETPTVQATGSTCYERMHHLKVRVLLPTSPGAHGVFTHTHLPHLHRVCGGGCRRRHQHHERPALPVRRTTASHQPWGLTVYSHTRTFHTSTACETSLQ